MWAVGVASFAIWVVVGWTLKRILFAWLRFITAKTETELDDALIAALNLPITLMICVWGAAAVVHFVIPGIPSHWLARVRLISTIASMAAFIFFVDGLMQNLLDIYAKTVEVLRVSQSFTSVVIHIVVLSIGALIILDSIGVSITPLIASLGIGSLAIALALQPTLENVFSGFQILIDQPVRLGHYIRLESGEEGFVEKITWRTSWLRQPPNNMVILPNKQLVNARIINFNYPTPEQALTIEVGVHYDSDLEKVERIAIETGRQILKSVPGSVAEFEPLVRFHTFGASSINFTVILRAKALTDSGLIKHEFIKALSKRFAGEKIVIPYPIVALNTVQENAILN